jgi:threonine dehydrogenase-like Zn-dependent dehydrogenase
MISVHLESGRVELRRKPTPRAVAGYARIRLIAAGICSTDLELQRGYYGFSGTPGHEFVGVVTEVGGDDKMAGENACPTAWIGQRVVGEINLACGRCEWCRRGLGRHCPTRKVLGIVGHAGAFQEFLTLPVRNLHRVPRSIPDEHAVFIEPVAAACEILDQIKIAKGTRAAVLGDGKLGLLIAQVLHASGAEVYLLGRHRENCGSRGDCDGSYRKETAAAGLSNRRRCDGLAGRIAGRGRDVHAARHGGHEVDGTRAGADRRGAGDRERDHAGGLAVRAIRACDQVARVREGSGGRIDFGRVFAGSCFGRVRAGGDERDFESAASAAGLGAAESSSECLVTELLEKERRLSTAP